MALSFADTKKALLACIESRITAVIIGSPGLGKTALVREVAKEVEMPCHELLGSNCDAVDIAGLPYVVDGELRRALIPQIQACVDDPGILFLDELTSVPASVQAPLMRLLLEQYAGGQALHEKSCVLGAANKPEECPGGVELSAATVNRFVRIVDYLPTLDEIREFFDALGFDPEQPTLLNENARDFAATLAVETGLVELNPPRAAIDGGLPFASPRAWERGLRAFTAHGKEDDVGYALLSGAVGEMKASAFLGIRKLRKYLPSVDDIRQAPKKAKVPEERDRQIAALGLLSRVADKDTWASWVYAERLQPEIAAACGRVLMTRTPQGTSKWASDGKKSQVKLLAKVRRAM